MTTIDMKDPTSYEYQQVIFTKAHLKLCSKGMTPPRGMTKSRLMTHARNLTGAEFGQREYDKAIEALELRKQALLEQMAKSDG